MTSINFIYDINTYLKADTTLIALSGKSSLSIYPMIGYENDQPPIILYWYYPGIYSKEMPWFNKDVIKYQVLDSNADRMFAMGRRIQDLLSNSYASKIPSTTSSGKWGALLKGSTHEPFAQRDGFMKYELVFEIAWIQNS